MTMFHSYSGTGNSRLAPKINMTNFWRKERHGANRVKRENTLKEKTSYIFHHVIYK